MASLGVEDYRRILEKNEKTIKGSINLNCLLPKLRTKGLLTDDEYQLLLEIVTSHPYETHNSSQRLFQILLTKGGGNALNLFIEALQEEDEHLGHKTLAIALLGEVSSVKPKHATKRPPPAVPARTKTLTRTNQNQDPQPFSTPQPVRKQPLLPPSQRSRAVTMSDTKVAEEKALFVSYIVRPISSRAHETACARSMQTLLRRPLILITDYFYKRPQLNLLNDKRPM